MSSFLNLTPTLRIVIENPFLRKSYPQEGSVVAIIDTGYEGFLVVPEDVFQQAGLDRLQTKKTVLKLADGSVLESHGIYGTFRVAGLGGKRDGFIETYEGLQEIIAGTEALADYKLLLDYCAMRFKIEICQ